MLNPKFVAGLVGITAVVAGAVAIARSSANTNFITLPRAQPLAALCPKFDWPYGCVWRPEVISGTKRLSARKSKRHHLYMSFFN
jgi:hypothetical protein